MIGIASIIAGLFVASAVYLLLSRRSQLVAFGFLLLSNGANLLVLTMGGLPRDALTPILKEEAGTPADPLPQAFVLTAIVIGLGATALLLAFAARARHELGSDQFPTEPPP